MPLRPPPHPSQAPTTHLGQGRGNLDSVGGVDGLAGWREEGGKGVRSGAVGVLVKDRGRKQAGELARGAGMG